MSFGETFVRLLDKYRKPDGSRWTLKEIEDATDGFVRGVYLTNLKADRIRQPGLDRLKAIAHAVGFPAELWLKEPQSWDDSSQRLEARRTLAQRLELAFEVIPNERTGEPFTTREVAELSFGRLTEERLSRIRAGEVEDLAGAQYLALSEIFGVDVSYWYAPPEQFRLLDAQTVAALKDKKSHLILDKLHGRSDREKDIIINLLDQLDLLQDTSAEDGLSPDPPRNDQ